MKQKFTIKGIKISNALDSKPITVVVGGTKDKYPTINFESLKTRYHQLTCYETHQEIIFLRNGRVAYIFDKNEVYKFTESEN